MTDQSDNSAEPRRPRLAQEIARRNRALFARPLNPVMKTAATARELALAGTESEKD